MAKADIPTVMSTTQTAEEEANIAVAKKYMSIAYSPTENKGAKSVKDLCTADSWFWSPSTFPGCKTPMDYAESHALVMKSVNNLHIIRYDQAWAKDGHVLLRYTAEGSHAGEPYLGIQKSDPPKHARWSAAAIFEIEDGKVKSFTKDWDQKVMQIQLGWAPVNESDNPRWNLDSLANPEKAREQNDEAHVIDASNKIISPGFIDTYRHLWQTQLKGRHANDTLLSYLPSGNFSGALFSTSDLFWGQVAGAAESLDAGTTTVFDHSSCNNSPEYPSAAVQALLTSGIRSIYCFHPPRRVKSWDSGESEDDFFSLETKDSFQNLALSAPYGAGRVQIGYCFEGLGYLPPDIVKQHYRELRDSSKGKASIITTHGVGGLIVGENPNAIEKLAKYDLLGPDILISHANFPHDNVAQLFSKSGAHLSSTPQTELQMGRPPLALRPEHYDHSSLGIDCHSWGSSSIPLQMNLLLQSTRFKRHEDLRKQNHWSRETGFLIQKVFNLGTIGGAKALGLQNKLGRIKQGFKADLVIFDTTSPSMLAAAEQDPIAAVVLHSRPGDIDMVMVDGIVRKAKGALLEFSVAHVPNEGRPVIQPGTMLSWTNIVEGIRESRHSVLEKMKPIDWTLGERAFLEMQWFDQKAMLEIEI